MHVPFQAHPLSCRPPVTYAPAMHNPPLPCITHPLPCMPHPLPCMSPLPTHAPSCHTCPLPCMPPCHAHPTMHMPHHAYLSPCMPFHQTCPCHACSPPAMHASTPAMHAPYHACPPAMHTPPAPVDRMTDACENIAFLQLLMRRVIIGWRPKFKMRLTSGKSWIL